MANVNSIGLNATTIYKNTGAMDMDNKIYVQLFEIANKNMQQSGKTFDHRRAAFFYYIKNDPYKIDILKLLETEVSNEEFIDIAYMAFWGHLADENSRKYYKNNLSYSHVEFRQKLICDIINSQEAKIEGKKILNFIDESESKIESKLLQRIMVRILPVYKKLPNILKRCIRIILKVGEE